MDVQHFSSGSKVSHSVSSEISPSFGWVVAGSYVIERVKLHAGEIRVVTPDWGALGGTTCRPGLKPHLLQDFAACSDEQSLLNFIGRHGLLGFRRMYPSDPDGASWKGDPVIWALGHAQIVSGVMRVSEMIRDVRAGRVLLNDKSAKRVADSLAAAFRHIGMKGPNPDPQPFSVTFDFLRPQFLGDEECRSTKWVYDWERDPVGGSYVLLAWLINPMIKGIHYGFSEPEPGEWLDPSAKLALDLSFDSLIEVIYWRLAGHLGEGFLRCKRCGRVFPAQGRRLYCSDECLNKSKCKKYRDKKRDETTDLKPSIAVRRRRGGNRR
jgi:uncharacterized C2H2 Zn-finger protein